MILFFTATAASSVSTHPLSLPLRSFGWSRDKDILYSLKSDEGWKNLMKGRKGTKNMLLPSACECWCGSVCPFLFGIFSQVLLAAYWHLSHCHSSHSLEGRESGKL